MFKYWVKNRFLFSLITILALGAMSFFVFNKPYLETKANNLLITSVYEKSEIDFDIPSPTKEQLNEIKKLEYIDDVFGYYFTESPIKIGSKSKKAKILFSDMLDSLNFTMYNPSRLISSKEGLNNPVYIDYEFSQKNNTIIGDELVFNNIRFQVGRIYETNSYYGSAIFIPLVGEQKVLIESISKSYSGAYLKCNDIAKTDNFLKKYKPLGRLKSSSDFATDEEYQKHYNSWNNASYYNEITSFHSKIEGINKKNSINYLIGIIFSGLLVITLFIMLSLRKCEKNYFFKKKDKKGISSYYVFSSFFDAIFLTITLVSSVLLSKIYVTNYLPTEAVSPMIVSSFIGSIIVLVIELIYGIGYVKKLNK